MMVTLRTLATAGAALLLVAAGAAPDGFSGVRALWQAARSVPAERPGESARAFDTALAASPGNNGLLLSAIGAASRTGGRVRLRSLLTRYAVQGGALPADQRAALAAAMGVRESEPPFTTLAANDTVLAAGMVAATLPANIRLVEGIARDDRDGALYVSSVAGRTIHRVGTGQALLRLGPDLGAPLALAIDGRRRTLWAALDPKAPGAAGKGGLLKLSLDTGWHGLVTGPADIAIGDVTVGRDGTVYAADSRSGAVYRCRPGCAALETVLAPGVLRSAQGMAATPDGRRLYVADYAYGVALVDTASGAARPLRTVPGVAIDGLDGLAWRDGHILAVQNGWRPARLIEIALDRSGETALSILVIARGGALEDPTQLAVAPDGSAVIVANAQWDRYGNMADPRTVAQRPTRLLRIQR